MDQFGIRSLRPTARAQIDLVRKAAYGNRDGNTLNAEITKRKRGVLRKMEYSTAQADRRISAMQAAFEDACVTGYADLVASMTNDEKDRHVLAAAVRTGAHAILTENVKHFPAASVEPYDIDVLTPDQFLAHQFHLNRELLEEKLCGQAKARGIAFDALVRRLAKWAPSLPGLLLESS